MANETLFSRIYGKEDNLASYTQIFENFVPGISVPFDFSPYNLLPFGKLPEVWSDGKQRPYSLATRFSFRV